MLHKKKPFKKNNKPKNNVRGQKVSIIHIDCTEGCKYYPKGCGDCPYEKENTNE